MNLLALFVIASVLHALATGLTTQRTTGAVDSKEQRSLLGLEHGLFSLARIGGPPLGTALLADGSGFWLVASACGAIDISLVAVLFAADGQLAQTPKFR